MPSAPDTRTLPQGHAQSPSGARKPSPPPTGPPPAGAPSHFVPPQSASLPTSNAASQTDLRTSVLQPTIPRNVSFANTSSESTAYREHNPPAVLRRQEAARREGSPQHATFQLGAPHSGSAGHQTGHAGSHQAASHHPSHHHPSYHPVHHPGHHAGHWPGHPLGAQSSPSPSVRNATPVSIISPTYSPQAAAPSGEKPEHHPEIKSDSVGDKDVSNDAKSEEVHILVAVTGSVATIKLPLIVHKLKQLYRKRAIINVVVTKASTVFFDRADLPKDVTVWYDSDEWRSREVSASHPNPGSSGSANAPPVTSCPLPTSASDQLHIRLRRWADILLVAPCSANTLAKLTYGICDNLLTSIFRVWNPEVPILIAPAMNTHMYTNPVTKRHFNVIKESFPFVEILRPVEKVLVCGDIGMGGMREWNDIVQVLVKRVGVNLDSESDDEDDDDD